MKELELYVAATKGELSGLALLETIMKSDIPHLEKEILFDATDGLMKLSRVLDTEGAKPTNMVRQLFKQLSIRYIEGIPVTPDTLSEIVYAVIRFVARY